MATFGVKVSRATFSAMTSSLAKGSRTLQRVRETMEQAAEEIKANGEKAWPRTYTTRGDPASDEWYRKLARKKGHNIPIPSAESFVVETRASDGQLTVVLKSDAAWAYAIRSRQVGETESQRRDRFTWEKGQTEEQYKSQKQLGQKRHAWSTIMVRPFKKVQRQLGAELLKIIEEGL